MMMALMIGLTPALSMISAIIPNVLDQAMGG
jgi:hypothetical protein